MHQYKFSEQDYLAQANLADSLWAFHEDSFREILHREELEAFLLFFPRKILRFLTR